MALRTTPTIAICLICGIAAGIALARPGDQAEPVASTPVEAVAVAPAHDAQGSHDTQGVRDTQGNPDSPYLLEEGAGNGGVDGESAPLAAVDVAAPVEISIESFAFSTSGPVTAGSTITVTNLDGADHTLTANDGEFDTGILAQGESVTIVVPDTPGTYEFFCEVHPSMTGELVVS